MSTVPERPGICPEDTLAEGGRKLMRFQWEQVLAHEEGARQGEDILALKAVRVATRRLRAAFEVFGPAYRSKTLRPLLKGLRTTGRKLGAVRDLDVLTEKARRYQRDLEEAARTSLTPLLDYWQAQREQARRELLLFLDQDDFQNFKLEFGQFVTTPGMGTAKASKDEISRRVRDQAPLLIYARLAAVSAFEESLKEASIEHLHALRIEFKKLRYTIEFFEEVLSEEARLAITELRKLQDHLGELNDAQVAVEQVNAFLAQEQQAAEYEQVSLEGVALYLANQHARRHQLLLGFPEAWERFHRSGFRRGLALALAGPASPEESA